MGTLGPHCFHFDVEVVPSFQFMTDDRLGKTGREEEEVSGQARR